MVIWLDSLGSDGLYYSCQVVRGVIPENVCVCSIFSDFVNNAHLLKILSFLIFIVHYL